MKVKEIIAKFREDLAMHYSAEELEQIIFLVFESEMNFKRTDLVLEADRKLHIHESLRFNEMLGLLIQHTPIQYVLGHAWFDGMKFYVNKDVLIPRQETEELVQWIETSIENGSSIAFGKCLDIGTGSGCIAISLKKRLPHLAVLALDISELALKVAGENAKHLGKTISLFQADILKWEKFSPDSSLAKEEEFEIIVSNPPYVLQEEKKRMESRVTDFEPHSALFVPDSDPLLFYKKIASYAVRSLKPEGYLYFEINEAKGSDMIQLLSEMGFVQVEIKNDMQNKPRMIRGRKP